MKVRNGFVSNSSSSSFCIYGAVLSKDKVIKNFNSMTSPQSNAKDTWEVSEALGVEIEDPWYDDEVYVGLSWSSIGDDETGREFKERVEKIIKKLMPEFEGELMTHEEAWRDG